MAQWYRATREVVKPVNARDSSSVPGSGRSPGEGLGNPLQYSCLENSMDRGAWWVTFHGVSRVGHDLVTKSPCRKIAFKPIDIFALGLVMETTLGKMFTI